MDRKAAGRVATPLWGIINQLMFEGAHMYEDWITHQIQLCELHIHQERQRLKEERQRKAREALVVLSLPELLGEVCDPQDEAQLNEAARIH